MGNLRKMIKCQFQTVPMEDVRSQPSTNNMDKAGLNKQKLCKILDELILSLTRLSCAFKKERIISQVLLEENFSFKTQPTCDPHCSSQKSIQRKQQGS